MNSRASRHLASLAVVALSAAFIFGAVFTASAQDGGPGTPGYTGPNLEIPIPGVEFSGIIRDENITIPWLGQYIGGVYSFLISIVGLLAASVIIVGGFQYVTSAGDKGKIGAAKKRIANAMIGLLLVLGSYTILYVINPDLTQFEGLQIFGVTRELAYDSTLGTTEEETSAGVEEPDPSAVPPAVTACPFTLTKKKGTKEAKLEFYAAVKAPGVVTASGKRNQVLQIAQIADACDVNLGSCGATAGAINALANVGDTSCLATAESCNDHSKGPEMFAISGRQRREIYGRNCSLWSTTKMVNGKCLRKKGKKCLEYEKITKAEETRRTLVSVWRKFTPDPEKKAEEVREGCFSSNSAATKEIRNYLLKEAEEGRLPADWPYAWTKKLQPGDRLVIYNGNNDLVGSHAVIFMGWASEGKMNVVQGGNGGRGTQKNVTRPGQICITPKCSKDNFVPLINGWSPG